MDGELQSDDVQIPPDQEVANSPNLPAQTPGAHLIPTRNQVHEELLDLRNRAVQPPVGAHLIPGRNQDGNGGTFIFDRSNPNIHLLDRGLFSLRMNSFHDWPESLQAYAWYLAQNGFFYTGSEDRVACCYCLTRMLALALLEDYGIRRSVCLPNCPYTQIPMALVIIIIILSALREMYYER